jgi:hypothetical protein
MASLSVTRHAPDHVNAMDIQIDLKAHSHSPQHGRLTIVHGDPGHRVKLVFPRAPLQCARGVFMPCLPTRANTRAGEIDVSRIAFALNVRGIEPHDMHERSAPICGEPLHFRADALIFWHQLDEFADDMAEPMKVLLAGDVAVVAARELDVFLAAEHILEDCGSGPEVCHI